MTPTPALHAAATAAPWGVTSNAVIVTNKAERYAKQLVSHLGHKLDFRTDGSTSTASIGAGTGQVVFADDGSALTDALATVEHVLGSHLERFAQRDGLTVAWTRSSPDR
jgi:hypothetical protein